MTVGLVYSTISVAIYMLETDVFNFLNFYISVTVWYSS